MTKELRNEFDTFMGKIVVKNFGKGSSRKIVGAGSRDYTRMCTGLQIYVDGSIFSRHLALIPRH